MATATPKPIKCKAAVGRAAGEPLQIEEVVVAPPKAHEVRIKIICTSLCHSDVTFWRMKGNPLAVHPRIFGHEAVGTIESIGEHVDEFKVGDLVVPVFTGQCHECADCTSERGSNICSLLPFRISPAMPRDGTTRFTDMNGESIYHFTGVSSFSEYTVVDVTQVVKLDAAVEHNKLCLLSCGVSTGVGAAWKLAGVDVGSTVAIFGLGSVGLAVAEGCRIRGASRIIGVDLNPDKFELGKKFGLTDFVNPKEIGDKSVSKVITEMTNGGADYCFECIGLASLMSDAFKSTHQGWGKTIILGVEMHGSPLCIAPYELLNGRCVMGSLFGGIKPKDDIPTLLNKYLNKELELDKFITHEIGLDEINKAFDLLLEGKSLRCIIWMDK
ncbi:alcohol dehydrogenase [Rhynchospora pubera]|uniref:Alcohol dehydrogenase n=1 Tax=Rhynchospora pubera TaxID=906938 RepID=A0AAV8DGI6_9POAL|nr:alcohol dehydrogenase [Rhynchospora pubera]KAJ4796550.1 alcohol dehydrogenase [Rhynchospora pubera]